MRPAPAGRQKGGGVVDRYKILLVDLLQRIDQKLEKLSKLLEVSKDAKKSGDDGADPDQ